MRRQWQRRAASPGAVMEADLSAWIMASSIPQPDNNPSFLATEARHTLLVGSCRGGGGYMLWA